MMIKCMKRVTGKRATFTETHPKTNKTSVITQITSPTCKFQSCQLPRPFLRD